MWMGWMTTPYTTAAVATEISLKVRMLKKRHGHQSEHVHSAIFVLLLLSPAEVHNNY